ncbi:receptor-type tyrosine-protein phosphatase-like N [Boleophthalmus pectinirostris]|uniref:receptor-type tyrosine-protein phosphatase-like N n=1 Tax=Boleophthalmus pectinirostris TaxID=150288 RepID=UPI00243201B3|nr:receptor-type tyrosine-protein phosphatase-like N [Boleophthalmus pectinirostris]
MRSARLWAALCLVLSASCSRHGCLFEKNLCGREQICSDDGLFGQCHSPDQIPVQYQVSAQVLHRLQQVLKELMEQGLTWRDDMTQAIISQELSRVPTETTKQVLPGPGSGPGPGLGPGYGPGPGPEVRSPPSPDEQLMQQFVDYMILEPSQSSVHSPLVDPYSFKQQQQFGYQDEEERSLNSLDQNPVLSRSKSQPGSLDRDQQLLQDLVSYYLGPPSSGSSHHAGALSSGPSFFPDLDFPLDYGHDFVSQTKQQQQNRKPQKQTLAAVHEGPVQSLASLLDHISESDRQDLPSSLKQLSLDSSYHGALKGTTQSTPSTGSSAFDPSFSDLGVVLFSEGSMSYKSGVSSSKSGKPETAETNQDRETDKSLVEPALKFKPNPHNTSSSNKAASGFFMFQWWRKLLTESDTLQNDGTVHVGKALPLATPVQPRSRWAFATLVAMAIVGSVLVAAMTIACLRHHAHRLAAKKLGLGPEAGTFTHQEYQDLCRQHMASKGAFGRLEAAALGAVGGAGGGGGGAGGGAVGGAYGGAVGGAYGGAVGGAYGGAAGGADSRVSSVSSQFSEGAQASPSSHSSTPSWCEEPAQANMDISTGHMILAYMEDHLRNKDRLLQEWQALCSYQAEPSAMATAQSDANAKKNRCPDSLPYDHARVKLKAEINPSRSDYINASPIIEHDPRMPAYIATQGPLSHTISDFWQMVWEHGCTVIVMLSALVEDGEKQCDRYWPDEGSSLYHIYEVNLVSEHIWCNDFLVRSFYLKNVQTQETRTLTQFHFLSWPAQGIPTSTRPLLDFRRKVNKCYRGRSCPIIVHCSDGTGRTGTYILIDMVLNRMAKGVKEIDIAATLEHVRDQRPGMVRTKDQFEFALTAVAEEVNAILKALPQ